MKIGFDNEKYLKMQSEHIRERIGQFDNKLYLEFGGKLFDDFHASRVLPGFQPARNFGGHLVSRRHVHGGKRVDDQAGRGAVNAGAWRRDRQHVGGFGRAALLLTDG